MTRGYVIQESDVKLLLEYITENRGKIFSEYTVSRMEYFLKSIVLCENEIDITKESKLLFVANDIIEKCSILLKIKGKNYKLGISYLFMALHNIPRAFIVDPLYLGVSINPITEEDAKQYVSFYMDLYRKHII